MIFEKASLLLLFDRARREELLRIIETDLDCEPRALAALAKHDPNAPLPELEHAASTTDRWLAQRSGAVEKPVTASSANRTILPSG